MTNRHISHRRSRQSHRAFTIIEMMVALGILAILLVIIVLPLRLGFDSFNAGNARSLTQSSLDSTMTQFEMDFRNAVYIIPNAPVAGVTNKEPYTTANNPSGFPYYLSTDNTDIKEPGKGAAGVPNGIACSTSSEHWANTSTISMIQVRRDDSGNVLTPLAPSYNIVTYYARRAQLDKDYDPIDNPVVMYRAEYPAFAPKGTDPDSPPAPLFVQSPTGAYNAKVDFKRITSGDSACTTDAALVNRSALWLSHNYLGEADLLPLTRIGKAGTPVEFTPATGYSLKDSTYSHTLAIPRGLALAVSNGFRAVPNYVPVAPETRDAKASLVPDTTFICADSNGDGKIDRITISLALASFSVGAQGELKNNQPVGTVLRATRTVNLPNIQ